MSAAPLPPLPTPFRKNSPNFTANQVLLYATQARADLEAENQRLREALQKAVDQAIWPSESISNALAEARAALKETP